MKTVWAIGGHDPNAVAGIQADLLCLRALSVNARTLIASFTGQSDLNVCLSEAVPFDWLRLQWTALAQVERPAVIKLGLLIDHDHIKYLAEAVQGWPEVTLIFDPVLAASSGHRFVGESIINCYREFIFPRTDLLTPNIPEAEQLLGYKIDSPATIVRAAEELRSFGPKAVLLKGGHYSNETDVTDYFDDGRRAFWLHGKRLHRNFRGTGCSLASSIAAYRARGLAMRDAVVMAHTYLQSIMRESSRQCRLYLEYTNKPHAVSDLSYELPRARYAFPSIGDPLGFYPIVPNLDWLRYITQLGVSCIQLRIKDQSGEILRASIAEASRICQEQNVRLFINDHWQEALESSAFGVHLGQEDLDRLDSDDLQRLNASGLRLGISTHSYEELARARALQPSYVALGPIFTTTCKAMTFGPQGLPRIAEWRDLCSNTPLVAIGGLRLEHAETALSYGASGLSVISDLLQANNPEEHTRAWLLACRKL